MHGQLNYLLFVASVVAFVVEQGMLFNNMGNREGMRIQSHAARQAS